MATTNTIDLVGAVEAAVWSRQGRREGSEIRCLCVYPGHNDRHPSGRYNPEKQTYYCAVCGTGCGIRELGRLLGLIDERPANGKGANRAKRPLNPSILGASANAKGAKAANAETDRTAFAQRIWASGGSLVGSLAERYLLGRGLIGPFPATLRFCILPHSDQFPRLPTMVAAVTVWPHRTPVAVHRTYLRPDGSAKADVEPCRKALGPICGGAVRLMAPTEQLAICEGIETALSFQQETGTPTWAVLGASNMAGLVIPSLPLAADIIIGADGDDAGLRAAYAAAGRWIREGRRVRVAVPPRGKDFNDLVRDAAC